MDHLEIEYKTLLTEKEFQNLLPLFSKTSAFKQTNYYFETRHNALQKAKIALRIRTSNETAELTVKVPQEVGNMEYNQPLTTSELQKALTTQQLPAGKITQLLNHYAIDLSQLELLGSLTTIRREMSTSIGLMALDESHYLQQTDYELELEVSDAAKGEKDFHHFLNQHTIHYQKALPKIVRFRQNLSRNS